MCCLAISCLKSWKLIFRLLHIVSIVGWTNGLSSEKLCESKVCSGCIAGSLSCQEGGLNRLPDELSADIQSIFMIGHKFDSPILIRENFSSYPHQTAQLQRLTLRNCGIEILEPGSFFDLQSVTQLDLSQNSLRIIESSTFAGLRLDLLRLDENVDLRLSSGAFRDATIVSLSMNQCGLSTLTYDDLAPLISTGALTNLHLSGNKLFTLDSRLEPSFLGLQSLSLENNPFTCDCRINWLADVLQHRRVKRQTRALDAFDSLVHVKPAELSALEGDSLQPTCRAPTRLVGRLLESLTATDFYCEPPRLRNLEVDLSHNEARELTNDLGTNERALMLNSPPLIVTLRCHVEGSPEMDLSWYQRISLDTKLTSQLGFYDGLEKLTKLPGSRNPKQGITEVVLTSPSRIRDLSRSISSLPIKGRLAEQFVCFGTDPSGSNATAEVRLHWPLETSAHEFVMKSSAKQANHYTEEVATKPDTDRERREEHPIGANAGLFVLTEDDINGFWLHPQYSALQMISAVVGTFLVTCILFLLGCCLLRVHHRHQDKTRTNSLLHNHSKDRQHSIPSTKLYPGHRQHHQQQQKQNLTFTSLPDCSSAIPSTAQNSALTTLVHPDGSQATAFANQLAYQLAQNTIDINNENNTVAGQAPVNNGTHNLSGVSAVTIYEPITSSETVTSTTYSDSQTYDLPQFPSQIYPPLPPLPSNAGGVMMATPGPFRLNQHGTINTHLPFIFSPLTNDPKAVRFETSTLLPQMLVNTSATKYSQPPASTTVYAASIGTGPSAMHMTAATLSRLHNGACVPGTPNASVTMSTQNLAVTPNHLFNLVPQPHTQMFHHSVREVT